METILSTEGRRQHHNIILHEKMPISTSTQKEYKISQIWSIGSKKKIKDNANKMTTQITKDTMSLNVMTIVKLENHLTLYH